MAKETKVTKPAAKAVEEKKQPAWLVYIEHGLVGLLRIPVDILLAYGAGVLFDVVLGTRAWPLFLLMGMLGFLFRMREVVEGDPIMLRLGYAVGAVPLPLAQAFVVALALTFFMPSAANAMTGMVVYKGPLYILVLWAGGMGTLLVLVSITVEHLLERLAPPAS